MNLYAESMQDPGDNVTDQDLSQYDESERGTVNAKTARETVSHSKRKGESLTLEDNSTTARSNPSNAKVSHSFSLKQVAIKYASNIDEFLRYFDLNYIKMIYYRAKQERQSSQKRIF